MKFLRQSWQELDYEIVFYKTEVMKIENFFSNKEINAFHLCESLKLFSKVKREKHYGWQNFLQYRQALLPQKNQYPERINLTEKNDSLLKHCEEVAKELNDFLANAVKNLNIPNYENCDSLAENINDPTLNAVVKWINHPSILAIASQ